MGLNICTKPWAIVIGVFACISLISSCILLGIYGTFDIIVFNVIKSSISIVPSSKVYPQWKKPDTPVYFSIYLFNITNREEILKGEKPRVQQIGPYVYREVREKTNITSPRGDNSQVRFYQRMTFFLERNLSVGDPDKDTVVGVSMPLVTLAANMEMGSGPSGTEYSLMVMFASPKLFVTTSVTDFLWGYRDPVTDFCNSIDSTKCPSPKVGVMLGKNGTDVGPFVIDTGVKNITNVGQILSFKGNSSVDVWSSEKANKIRGTDGSHFDPFLEKGSKRYIFASDLCRSFELMVYGEGHLTNSDKIKVLSLGGTPETALPPSENPDNQGFCPPKTPGPTCPPAGTFDLSSCRQQGDLRPPVYSSQPNFFAADPSLREGVDGLYEPTIENATTQVFVEPKLGLVLEAYKRLQISVYVRPSKMMTDFFQNWTTPVFLPLVWFEEKAVASKETLDELYESAYEKPKKGRLLLLISLGISLANLCALVITLIIMLICINRRSVVAKEGAKPPPVNTGLYDAKYSIVNPEDRTGAV